MILSQDIVRIVYYRGAFDETALYNTASCLTMYTIGITGICIRDLYIKALYCMEKGKTIIAISMLSVVINIILNFILSNQLGYIGLPLATSMSVWIMLPILVLTYHKYARKLLKTAKP